MYYTYIIQVLYIYYTSVIRITIFVAMTPRLEALAKHRNLVGTYRFNRLVNNIHFRSYLLRITLNGERMVYKKHVCNKSIQTIMSLSIFLYGKTSLFKKKIVLCNILLKKIISL